MLLSTISFLCDTTFVLRVNLAILCLMSRVAIVSLYHRSMTLAYNMPVLGKNFCKKNPNCRCKKCNCPINSFFFNAQRKTYFFAKTLVNKKRFFVKFVLFPVGVRGECFYIVCTVSASSGLIFSIIS